MVLLERLLKFCTTMIRNEHGQGEVGLNDLVKNELSPQDYHHVRGFGYTTMSVLQQHSSLGVEKDNQLLSHTKTLNKSISTKVWN